MAGALFAVLASWAWAAAPATPAPNWLKLYHLAPYKEIWSTELVAPVVEKATVEAVRIVEKNGGKLTAPLSAFAGGTQAQQMSFAISRKGALAAGKALKKIGKSTEPRVNIPAEAVSVDEVRAKLLALTAERDSRAQSLAAMPAVSALVEELIERLTLVESVQSKTDAEILWNINVQTPR